MELGTQLPLLLLTLSSYLSHLTVTHKIEQPQHYKNMKVRDFKVCIVAESENQQPGMLISIQTANSINVMGSLFVKYCLRRRFQFSMV